MSLPSSADCSGTDAYSVRSSFAMSFIVNSGSGKLIFMHTMQHTYLECGHDKDQDYSQDLHDKHSP